ncbi:VanZ family protein [Salipaludibacillus sp. CUR1]|uniref:VanZ family protein n=1 Tax=Salipaludibacillus sp. CUR1 TaxID=2820003 RepID=UPI001E2C38EA|nr:VanZ family protein [Salipaludibacillus sp. CUR1]MCE7791685.1 VanZ family protein [Salipaludibacillus sp. CUR1]
MSDSRGRFVVFYLIPFLFWAGLIYYSSSQTFEDQTVEPVLADFNLTWVSAMFQWVSFNYGGSPVSLQAMTPAEFTEFFIRKGAHVFTFAVLAVLTYRLISYFYNNRNAAAGMSLAFVLLYGSFDEYRQSLNPGRSGMVEDVILNFAGGILGLIVFLTVKKRLRGTFRSGQN